MTSADILQTILKWFVPFACGGIVSAIIFLVRQYKVHGDALQCLLRAEIIRQYEKWIDREWIPIYAMQALERAYNAYHALGGNDVATNLYNRVKELPNEEPKP